jgi:hypothetical protein
MQPSTRTGEGCPRFQRLSAINQKLTTATPDGACWTILAKKYGSAAMVEKIARGAYVFVVGTMIIAWVVSFNKETPAGPQTGPQVWYIHS